MLYAMEPQNRQVCIPAVSCLDRYSAWHLLAGAQQGKQRRALARMGMTGAACDRRAINCTSISLMRCGLTCSTAARCNLELRQQIITEQALGCRNYNFWHTTAHCACAVDASTDSQSTVPHQHGGRAPCASAPAAAHPVTGCVYCQLSVRTVKQTAKTAAHWCRRIAELQ